MKNDSLRNNIFRFIDLLFLAFLVFDFGYNVNEMYRLPKLIGLVVLTFALLGFNVLKYFVYQIKTRKKVALVNAILIAIVILIAGIVALANVSLSLHRILIKIEPILLIGLFSYFIMRLMILVRYIYDIYYNPAIMFVGSFVVIALAGALLLMLPSATTNGISFTDSLFTATSAVCVTGLAVLDTQTDFTFVGQMIILILIQIGGLGILTFTSFFAFFFRGNSSFKEGLNVKDFLASDNLKDVLKTALNVVLFTLGVELAGAIFIFFSTDNLPVLSERIFFSIFHSISAFCNAGFSTFSAGMYDNGLRFNYPLQWIIMALIIFGGLGYNIAYNFYSYLKNALLQLFRIKKIKKHIRIITLNTKIILYTSFLLLIAGFAFFMLAEYNTVLAEHKTAFGKITTAAFTSVTPRTAGFGTIDFTQLTAPSMLFMIFLMWIGASPASTGGGIKTSTFALATLNIWAIARGRNNIQIGGREISGESTKRAFAILCISLIVIGTSIVFLLILEPPGTDLLAVAFECFSAYSTVGLTLNLTPHLTEGSKFVIVVVMFIGRIGMLNLMIGLLRNMNHQFYQYPQENILIN